MSDNEKRFSEEQLENQSFFITEKMVTLSLATISKESVGWLRQQTVLTTKNDSSEITVYPNEDYGFFIPYPQDIKGKIIPNDLMYVFGYAEGKDANWILLDKVKKVSERGLRY